MPFAGCLAALAMQDAVARLDDTDLRIRVGLHTGEVVVQSVKNSIYQTYDAAGANVHLANRMEQIADEGGILITGDTYVSSQTVRGGRASWQRRQFVVSPRRSRCSG